MNKRRFDALIIVGRRLARACARALQLARSDFTVAVYLVFPTVSHTVSAQGGITSRAGQRRMTDAGNGTCMTRSRAVTGWAIQDAIEFHVPRGGFGGV